MGNRPLLLITMGDPAGVGPEVIAGVWGQAAVHKVCRPVVVGHPQIMRRAVNLWLGSSAARPQLSRSALPPLPCPAGSETQELVGRARPTPTPPPGPPLQRGGAEVGGTQAARELVGGAHPTVSVVTSPEEARPSAEVMPVIAACRDDALDVPSATIDARAGQAAYDAILTAARLALDGRVDGIVTAPIHKTALWQAGHRYPGHTELLAELCGVRDFAMMLYLGPSETIRSPGGLGVVHVTLHMALVDVFSHLTVDAIVAKAKLADSIMTRLKGSRPRIAVCALNPHAGEQGLFGDEEQRIIGPAVEAARRAGLDVVGPLPTDTLMVQARDGAFDGVVAMYHDQGHIALKLLGMHRAVNITLGLPIVRTSVAHGTAFDLAWQGKAETSSMVEAIRVAARLAGGD
ncbi:MAG: 4-hydroxythreonine-4-phosphate dehydrogenase PdxA [Planctomycetia bacterium]|nr:4-hydroxythreonine-4-phosphate dehydrogenase PdxA [Planctomycetia bacterium]